MNQLIILGYGVAFAVGFSTLIFAVLFYLKERNAWVKYYIVLMLVFTVLFVLYIFQLFNEMNTNVSSGVLRLFIFINLGLLSYLIPFVMSQVVGLGWTRRHNAVFLPAIAAYAVMLILSFALRHIVFYTIMNGIFYCALLYSIIIGLARLRQIPERNFKIITGVFVILSCIFAPFFFMDTYIAEIMNYGRQDTSYRQWAFPLYYFWWNVTVLGYLVGYFYRIRSQHDNDPSPEFIAEHRISEREKEIIKLIRKGRSNKEISAELFISLSTVNNHLGNIYEKTGFTSRFQLITLIKTRF